jgi:hypothetical protein
LPDIDGALAELDHALDTLGLDGVVLFSNVHGTYLGYPRFGSLFDELQRRAAVVFVHPNPSPDPSAHAHGLPDSLIDFPRRHHPGHRSTAPQQHLRPDP